MLNTKLTAKGYEETEMKRKLKINMVIMLILISMVAPISHGQVIWIDGGLIGDLTVSGTYEYQELCFITGEPVLLKGLLKVPEVPENSNEYTLKYSFELTNAAKGITLERDLAFKITKVPNSVAKQTTYEKVITKYDETITTGANVFTLGKYRFADSRIIDNTPTVDYYSGNIIAERTYYINGDAITNSGYVTYLIDAKPIVGYQHEYGNSENYVIHQEIQTYKPNAAYDPKVYGSKPYKVWTGTVDIGMSSEKTVNFEEQFTDPQSISFRGSFFQTTSEENVLTYKYSLPTVVSGVVDEKSEKISTGEVKLSEDVIMDSKALVTPKIRDIGGHWAQKEIELLTSLQVFAVDKEYFVPKAPISRLEFAKAMVVAIEGVLPEPTKTEIYKRSRPGVDTPYLDVLKTDPNYHYMEYIKANDIMSGKDSKFDPNHTITRSEAIAIMIRALGLQYIAPAPPYKTQFIDDYKIEEWAKDYIYVANEIGLITGTPDGQIIPNALLTKADAAALVSSYINHLKDNMRYDYREKILNR